MKRVHKVNASTFAVVFVVVVTTVAVVVDTAAVVVVVVVELADSYTVQNNLSPDTTLIDL